MSNFVDDFKTALDNLESDAKSVGLNLTSICRETGVSRATPDRWRKHIPKTIEIVAEMQRVVAEAKNKPASVEIDGVKQQLAVGADGTEKSETGLRIEE